MLPFFVSILCCQKAFRMIQTCNINFYTWVWPPPFTQCVKKHPIWQRMASLSIWYNYEIFFVGKAIWKHKCFRENISEILFIMRRWFSRSKLGQILKANCSDSDSGGQFYSNVPKFSQFSAINWDTVSGVDDSTQIFQYLVRYSVQYFQTPTVGWTILLKYSNIQWNI